MEDGTFLRVFLLMGMKEDRKEQRRLGILVQGHEWGQRKVSPRSVVPWEASSRQHHKVSCPVFEKYYICVY